LKIFNIDEVKCLYPRNDFWNQPRLKVVDHILRECRDSRSISVANLNSIKRALTPNSLPRRREITLINSVIEVLEEAGWKVRYLTYPLRLPREVVAPRDALAFEHFTNMLNERNRFWEGSFSLTEVELGTVLAKEIITTTALNPSYLTTILSALIDDPSCTSLTVTAAEGFEGVDVDIPISPRAQIISRTIYRARPTDARKVVIKAAQSVTQDKAKSYALLLSELGIESILISRLQRRTLPIPPPRSNDTFQFLLQNTERYPQIFYRNKSLSPSSVDANLAPTISFDSYELPLFSASVAATRSAIAKLRNCAFIDGIFCNRTPTSDEFERCFSSVKSLFIEHLKEHLTISRLTPTEKESVYKEITALGRSYTTVDFAVDYAHYYCIECHNTIRSLETKFSAIFRNGLLRFEQCFILEQWDDEDTEEFLDWFLHRDSLAEVTRRSYANSLGALIRFGQSHHSLFPNINVTALRQTGSWVTSRNRVLGLREFDLVIGQLTASDTNSLLRNQVVLTLAFYAGLRAIEITWLRLDDIVIGDDELYIYVRKSKTKAGIRAIPLHIIAPPEAISLVRRLFEQREDEHYRFIRSNRVKWSDYPLLKCYLFATTVPASLNNSPTAIEDARSSLQQLAGPAADLHLLRHSRASHLFLAWYCAKYPEFVERLSDNEHWCFSDEGLGALRAYLGEPQHKPLDPANTTAMIQLIKLFGHANIDTLFSVYVHSFDIVAHHALTRAQYRDGLEVLPGKVIGALIPNCRSRTSQAKLVDRSINALARS